MRIMNSKTILGVVSQQVNYAYYFQIIKQIHGIKIEANRVYTYSIRNEDYEKWEEEYRTGFSIDFTILFIRIGIYIHPIKYKRK